LHTADNQRGDANATAGIFLYQILQASLKDIKATGEAFSPQKRTSSTSKNEIY
jgi:hypothetical protein